MGDRGVQLRPTYDNDLWLFERQALDPLVTGPFNWSGFKDVRQARRRLELDGMLGTDDGLLIVTFAGQVAGTVHWGRTTYGTPQWWCWTIGISLLPEFRSKGVGTAAQRLLINYLFGTTTAERIEAYTDSENVAEQRALEKAGFMYEGTARSVQFREGRWRDVKVYSVVRPELTGAVTT